LLAVLKTGAAYVPLDPNFPIERLRYIVRDAGVRLLLVAADTAALWQEQDLTLVDAERPRPAAAAASGELDPDHAAYVIYTSGSTGWPKGVVVTHAAVANFLAAMARQPGIAATDRLLAVTTLSFDIAGLELYLPLTHGA